MHPTLALVVVARRLSVRLDFLRGAREPAARACPIRARTARAIRARPTCCAPAARSPRCSPCWAMPARARLPCGWPALRTGVRGSTRMPPRSPGWPHSSATCTRCITASRAAKALRRCSASSGSLTSVAGFGIWRSVAAGRRVLPLFLAAAIHRRSLRRSAVDSLQASTLTFLALVAMAVLSGRAPPPEHRASCLPAPKSVEAARRH